MTDRLSRAGASIGLLSLAAVVVWLGLVIFVAPIERTQGIVQKLFYVQVVCVPPPYLGFVWLMMRSHFLLTDSGGVQEEAPFLGKPVLVMRRVTERPEGVQAGCARVVGVDESDIVQAAEQLLTNANEYRTMSEAKNPYGDGTAAQKIVDAIEEWSGGRG